MSQEFNHEQFKLAISHTDAVEAEKLLQKFIDDHKLKLSVSEIIAIAKMICQGADTVCPIIKDL